MGQRHQLFVVARVHGRYRCVAAFHSQWLYGNQAVMAAARILRRLSAVFAGRVIETELSVVPEDEDRVQGLPAPYITGLVLSAFKVNKETFEIKTFHVLPCDIMPSRCDNNDVRSSHL